MDDRYRKILNICFVASFLFFTAVGYFIAHTQSPAGEAFWVLYLVPIFIGLTFSFPFLLLPYFIRYLLSMLDKKSVTLQTQEQKTAWRKSAEKKFIVYVTLFVVLLLMRFLLKG